MPTPGHTNPYAAPLVDEEAPPVRSDSSDRLPGYCRGWAIANLVFAALRGVMAAFGLFVLDTLPVDHPLYGVVVFGCAANIGMTVLGLAGNTLMLLKNPTSIFLCWAYVAAAVASIGVGVWEGVFTIGRLQVQAEQIGGVIGLVITLAVRTALLTAYCRAVRLASRWFQQRDEAQRANTQYT
ncbi:hypothetical protein Pla175_49010 [Pirellulimonas nuda]|uniref:Uncharacterized protein n=1 Tax=Pirellulimonas nuda TaxID=2528009 RepID=A0A518DJ61_9BACT|nr:hypothetical protein [Pirellulimonas nuda]QDU91472.1 hypothetical protein Pla175_49010 [Pirellulimonas nuda]